VVFASSLVNWTCFGVDLGFINELGTLNFGDSLTIRNS